MTVFVLLPAFNEEAAVESLVPKTCGALQESPFDLRIVIVDDGSTDRTAQRVAALSKSHPVDVLTHPTNLGLGQTIRDGIEHCVRRGGPGTMRSAATGRITDCGMQAWTAWTAASRDPGSPSTRRGGR